MLDCGKLEISDITHYQIAREQLAAVDMAVPCFLVAHPKGTLMWEAGAVPDSAFSADGTGKLNNMAVSKRTLVSQLAEISYTPADMTYIAFSHFHWDHIANANLFAGSTWIVPKIEHEVFFGETDFGKSVRNRPRMDPSVYASLRNSKTVIVTSSDYDVFGDGSVVLKSAPGHSPGHQVLFLNLAKTGPVLLSGDLYHYPEERTLKRVPSFEFSVKQTAESREAMEAFLQKTGAQLWIQHDLTANSKLRKSPAFYE